MTLDPTWAPVVHEPAAALLAVDFDGSLAPIVDDPGARRTTCRRRRARWSARHPAGSVVAVVTGRPVDVRASRMCRIRAVVVVGQYGLERDEGGRRAAPTRGRAAYAAAVAAAARDAEAALAGAAHRTQGRDRRSRCTGGSTGARRPTAVTIEELARRPRARSWPGRMAVRAAAARRGRQGHRGR